MTLTEIMIALVLLSVLSLLVVSRVSSTADQQADVEVRNLLLSVVAAQQIRHDTLGSFADENGGLDALVGSVSVVGGSTASTSDDEFSVLVSVSGGADVVTIAGLGKSGTCYAVEAFESSSSTQDRRVRFTPGPAGCTASAVSAAQDGSAW